jgi:hypothetical protein
MGAIVFNNVSFDSWLTKKADEILFKGQDRGISNEEMLILILKAHTQHFHHMDVEFRQEFKRIDERFIELKGKIDSRFEKNDSITNLRFSEFEAKMDSRFEKNDSSTNLRFSELEAKIDSRFEKMDEKIDSKFDKMWSFQKWQVGILITLLGGLYLKLFLG